MESSSSRANGQRRGRGRRANRLHGRRRRNNQAREASELNARGGSSARDRQTVGSCASQRRGRARGGQGHGQASIPHEREAYPGYPLRMDDVGVFDNLSLEEGLDQVFERMGNAGFSNAEYDTFILYGVKPWDDDAA
ncbi:hypothetical protein DENSPDRAFT_511417 [Dentipellis sp. KUC8613]|nr:hypothetical protein DENSPDRAFT_511417 [Dentipellis sp. KUC8613]